MCDYIFPMLCSSMSWLIRQIDKQNIPCIWNFFFCFFVNRDHQTTPMMGGTRDDNNPEQHGHTNGHSKKVFRKRLKRINERILFSLRNRKRQQISHPIMNNLHKGRIFFSFSSAMMYRQLNIYFKSIIDESQFRKKKFPRECS
jgi:hypothetical protein